MGNLALLKGDIPSARERLEKSLAIFITLGLRWEIAGTLLHLGKVAIASEDWLEAERLLKQAIKISLEAQVIPLAIDAALELADCFRHQGKVDEAMGLILTAMQNASITDAAKQRAGELKSIVEKQVALGGLEPVVPTETLETVLARLVD